MDATGVERSTIANRYRLTQQLGRGGMGSVWRAEDLTLGSPVAIKLIDPALCSDEAVRTRFYYEAKAAAALRSPHVVQILDYGVDAGTPFIVMELLEGETLADRLSRVRVLPGPELAQIFGDVARAMRKAHEAGVVHRDLKPENVFLVRNDDQEIAKVLDFGIAKPTTPMGAQSRQTRTGSLVGTPPYMSPEQARGAPVDHRSDLWSLGVIVFECLVGRLPFTAESPGEMVLQVCVHPIPVPSQLARVPRGLDAWMKRALDRDPTTRFQSAKDMADTLRSLLGVEAGPMSVSARDGSATSLGGLALRSGPGASSRLAVIFGAASLALAAAAAMFWLTRDPAVTVTTPSPSAGARQGPTSSPVVAVVPGSEAVPLAETAAPLPDTAATSTPKPVETALPRPVETASPTPVETASPRRVEIALPKPVETALPKPAETAKAAEPPRKKKDRIGW